MIKVIIIPNEEKLNVPVFEEVSFNPKIHHSALIQLFLEKYELVLDTQNQMVIEKKLALEGHKVLELSDNFLSLVFMLDRITSKQYALMLQLKEYLKTFDDFAISFYNDCEEKSIDSLNYDREENIVDYVFKVIYDECIDKRGRI